MADGSPEELARVLRDPSTLSVDDLNEQLLRLLRETGESVNAIGRRWQQECLETATPQGDPSKADDYVRPLISLAENLRRNGYSNLAGEVYESGARYIQRVCARRNITLHKGAVFANLAITHLEAQRYSEGMAWLYAAAEEDKRTYKIANPHDSYALSSTGIFGQWLDKVIAQVPDSLLPFLNANLQQPITPDDVKDFCLWLASIGDLRLASSIVDYQRVREYTDLHSSSVRLSVLRELSGLFEVLWKRLGVAHVDASCAAAFKEPPTLAALLCHMHFVENDNKKRRKDPALRRNKKVGLLWNGVVKNDSLVDVIDQEISECKKRLSTVWNWLSSTTLSPNSQVDQTAKRYLLAYKLRNVTSHSFDPADSTVCNYHQPMFEWLLQANTLLYFWAVQTGQVRL